MIPDTHLSIEAKQKPRRKSKCSKTKHPAPYRNPGLGVRFTHDEEILMALARISAKRYMEAYGKGRDSYNIDHSHYFPGIKQID